MEDDTKIVFIDPPSFPREEIELIAKRLSTSNNLVPGFLPPAAGLMSLDAFLYASLIAKQSTIIILDRNVASRMAKIAREGAYRPLDRPTHFAVDLMALSQAMNLDLDPAIAFHELAHMNGNEEACEELRWFRAADFGQAHAWIDVALGRADALPVTPPARREDLDLAAPLGRWRRNYVVMLKAAELELLPMTPKQRMRHLIEWMISDFIVAGPAMLYCAMYFSPFAPKSGMFKSLRSPDRARAIAGIKNAAWDVTYLSELARQVAEHPDQSKRFIIATADEAVAQIAPLLFSNEEGAEALEKALSGAFERWWRGDANDIASDVVRAIETATARSPVRATAGRPDPIGDLIFSGEATILGK